MLIKCFQQIMKKVFDRIASFLTKSPTRFFFVAAIAAFFILWFVNAYKDPDGFIWHDVIVESHGVLFDLLVFGILLSIYDALREKKEKIERLHEEIDDYRGWNENEAMYRIVGAIRRLNKLNVSKIDLGHCYLKGANLKGVKLKDSWIQGADLQNADLKEADLQGADLTWANLQGAELDSAKLQGAILSATQLNGAVLRLTNLQQADLQAAVLEDVKITPNWFQQIEEWQVQDREAIIEKYYIDDYYTLQLRNPPTP